MWSWTSIILQWFSYAMASLKTSKRKTLCVNSDINIDLQFLEEEQNCILLQQKASKPPAVGISFWPKTLPFFIGIAFSIASVCEWLGGIASSSLLSIFFIWCDKSMGDHIWVEKLYFSWTNKNKKQTHLQWLTLPFPSFLTATHQASHSHIYTNFQLVEGLSWILWLVGQISHTVVACSWVVLCFLAVLCVWDK